MENQTTSYIPLERNYRGRESVERNNTLVGRVEPNRHSDYFGLNFRERSQLNRRIRYNNRINYGGG